MPEVSQFVFYTEAFKELDTCRNSGFGVTPIPFLAIVEYAKMYEVDDFEEFLFIIRSMDNKFVELSGKKDGNK